MTDFESIRPYEDREVPEVVARLVRDPSLVHAAAIFSTPRLASWAPALARWLAARVLEQRTREVTTISDVQNFLNGYMERLVAETIEELSVTGLDSLTTDGSYLYISNHRDIFMDTGLLNYVIYHAGHQTARSAVGDNLLTEKYAADLMRLNKSFVIERSVTGTRAVYRSLSRTSDYIRHSLETNHSVWIAQRDGRAKDGFDRTEPALLKMVALAHRKQASSFAELVHRVPIVPVSISYELDPCDRQKAHELAFIKRWGEYHKAANEDLMSIVQGMTNYKGRVHLHFSAPMTGSYEDAESLALGIDAQIISGLEVFPTQAWAARELGLEDVPATSDWLPKVKSAFEARLKGLPPDERLELLNGYGNLIRNRQQLGLNAQATMPIAEPVS
jgi:1-acyl-sn-glycerol-3-phosphate acyltransferase